MDDSQKLNLPPDLLAELEAARKEDRGDKLEADGLMWLIRWMAGHHQKVCNELDKQRRRADELAERCAKYEAKQTATTERR